MDIATRENLLEVLHAANVALFYKELSGSYLFMNDAGARMVGRTAGEVQGRHDREIFAPRTCDVIALRDHHISGLDEPFAYDCHSTLLSGGASLGFHSIKLAVRTPERRDATGLICLSVPNDLMPPLMSDMRELLRSLVQFRPERLLAICRRGAHLNLI